MSPSGWSSGRILSSVILGFLSYTGILLESNTLELGPSSSIVSWLVIFWSSHHFQSHHDSKPTTAPWWLIILTAVLAAASSAPGTSSHLSLVSSPLVPIFSLAGLYIFKFFSRQQQQLRSIEKFSSTPPNLQIALICLASILGIVFFNSIVDVVGAQIGNGLLRGLFLSILAMKFPLTPLNISRLASCVCTLLGLTFLASAVISNNPYAHLGLLIESLIPGILRGAQVALIIKLLTNTQTVSAAFTIELASALLAGLVYYNDKIGPFIIGSCALGICFLLWSLLTPEMGYSDYLPQLQKGHHKHSKHKPRALFSIALTVFLFISSWFTFVKPISVRLTPSMMNGRFKFKSTLTHPMMGLMEQSKNDYTEAVSRQSMTLRDAVKRYKERYGMNPPPNFDKWFDFAKERQSLWIDDYDSIHHSLRFLWGIEPSVLRSRVRTALSNAKGMTGVILRSARVEYAVGSDDDWLVETLSDMINPFAEHLPDMDIAFNTHDENRMTIPAEELANLIKAPLSSGSQNEFTYISLPDIFEHTTNDTYFIEATHQGSWQFARSTCPLDSRARNESDELIDDDDKYLLSSGFLFNQSASCDVCISPSLKDMQGMIIRPNSLDITTDIFPIFSPSKLGCFQDIMYPSPWYFADRAPYDKSADVMWDFKSSQIIWRGATTGCFSRLGSWKKCHRQRFVKVMEQSPDSLLDILQLSKDDTWQPSQMPKSEIDEFIDVHFNRVEQCDPEDCIEQESVFHLGESIGFQDLWRYKFLMDIDGNSLSGRFYSLLKSNSAVVKQTVIQEWHTDRIYPWYHYIPLSYKMKEFGEMVRFLFKEDDGSRAGKQIAQQGQSGALQSLRREDMQIYFFRLLLEYARVMDDNRLNLGFTMS